jgi:hypothetical protein
MIGLYPHFYPQDQQDAFPFLVKHTLSLLPQNAIHWVVPILGSILEITLQLYHKGTLIPLASMKFAEKNIFLSWTATSPLIIG